MNKTQNLRRLLTELIEAHNLGPKILEQKVFALWRKHLGPPLSIKTAPVSLSNGILKVHTEHPVYITELSFYKQQILTDLNAELGRAVLTDLRIELRPARAIKPHESEGSTLTKKRAKTQDYTPLLTSEQLGKIEQALTNVSDTQLKKSLEQLFTTQSIDKPLDKP